MYFAAFTVLCCHGQSATGSQANEFKHAFWLYLYYVVISALQI